MTRKWANSLTLFDLVRPRRSTCDRLGEGFWLVQYKMRRFLIKELQHGVWAVYRGGYGVLTHIYNVQHGKESVIEWIETNCDDGCL